MTYGTAEICQEAESRNSPNSVTVDSNSTSEYSDMLNIVEQYTWKIKWRGDSVVRMSGLSYQSAKNYRPQHYPPVLYEPDTSIALYGIYINGSVIINID